MKKPDEIKKGLNVCAHDLNCNSCPYKGFRCTANLMQDAAEALQQKDDEKLAMQRRIDNMQQHIDLLHGALNESERKNAKLTVELEAVKRERDAAMRELPHNCWNCKYHMDKHVVETDDQGRTIHIYCDADYCFPEEENSSWEWRGVQENGGAEDGK